VTDLASLPVAALPPPEDFPGHGGLLARNGRAVRKLIQRQLFGREDNGSPGISTVMFQAFNIVQDRIARSRLAGDPPDIMIAPPLPAVGLFDFHRAEEMIQCGVEAAERAIEHIKREIVTRRFNAVYAHTG
jgi:NTE family protein